MPKLKRRQAALDKEINKLQDEVKKFEKKLKLHKVSFNFYYFIYALPH